MTHHKGIHHITIMAGDPKKNVHFYTKVLGMRMVKKSVNQDDPGTYHLFYGNHSATPGSSITFFPWPRASQGEPGTGEVVNVSFQVSEDSEAFWKERFEDLDVEFKEVEMFGKKALRFYDPDRLELDLVFQGEAKPKVEHVHYEIPPEHTIQGFWGARIRVTEKETTETLLRDLFNFEEITTEDDQTLYQTDAPVGHSVILELSEQMKSKMGRGTVHHIAFRAEDKGELQKLQEEVDRIGLHPTQIIDRHWFRSVYYRIPQGVLFEMASDDPGYTVDEEFEQLGETLILPPWLEEKRDRIERILPELS